MKHIQISAGYIAAVDDEDYEALSAFVWTALVLRNRKGDVSIVYAWRWTPARDGPKKMVYMHRQVAGVADRAIKIDHRDHNGLNNCRSNLRVSTVFDNHANSRICSRNTSGYKGVTWYKNYGKWMAQITSHGRRRCLGYFVNIEDAAKAYGQAANVLFGDFAYTGDRTTSTLEPI